MFVTSDFYPRFWMKLGEIELIIWKKCRVIYSILYICCNSSCVSETGYITDDHTGEDKYAFKADYIRTKLVILSFVTGQLTDFDTKILFFMTIIVYLSFIGRLVYSNYNPP